MLWYTRDAAPHEGNRRTPMESKTLGLYRAGQTVQSRAWPEVFGVDYDIDDAPFFAAAVVAAVVLFTAGGMLFYLTRFAVVSLCLGKA